jgi:hypothetical protein
MNQSAENPLVTRIRALAQHELAHFVAAISLGFKGYEVTFKVHPTEHVHRGSSRVDAVVRCDTLVGVREFMHKRAIVLLAGVMGESISRSTLQVDMLKAKQLLELGETGAGQDHAVAKELAQLLDNSASEAGGGLLPARGAGAMRVFQELFTHAASVVQINVEPVCALADMLASRVTPTPEGLIGAVMSLTDMDQTEVFQLIRHVSLSELVL